jgi:hypothetical protein
MPSAYCVLYDSENNRKHVLVGKKLTLASVHNNRNQQVFRGGGIELSDSGPVAAARREL